MKKIPPGLPKALLGVTSRSQCKTTPISIHVRGRFRGSEKGEPINLKRVPKDRQVLRKRSPKDGQGLAPWCEALKMFCPYDVL